jgi:serine/threonine protein phosphatase PrpC
MHNTALNYALSGQYGQYIAATKSVILTVKVPSVYLTNVGQSTYILGTKATHRFELKNRIHSCVQAHTLRRQIYFRKADVLLRFLPNASAQTAHSCQ